MFGRDDLAGSSRALHGWVVSAAGGAPLASAEVNVRYSGTDWTSTGFDGVFRCNVAPTQQPADQRPTVPIER